MADEQSFTISGRITYTDSFEGKYETVVCLIRLLSGAVSYCREGNYMK